MVMVNIGGVSFLVDESCIFFYSNESGIYNVYVMLVGGGKLQQLIDFKIDSYYVVGFFFRDDCFFYICDQGGNEFNYFYVCEFDGYECDLMLGDKFKVCFVGWSGDDMVFYVVINECDVKFFDVYCYDN